MKPTIWDLGNLAGLVTQSLVADSALHLALVGLIPVRLAATK